MARGLASLVMIQGHAYHGWVAPEHHDAAYAFTRVLGTLPLPAFLVLAGAAMMLRLESAARRHEDARVVRNALMRRGGQLVVIGYAVNATYALIDGAAGLHTWLRADVLHVIGLSLLASAWLGLPTSREVSPTRFARRAAALATVVTLLCPWLSPLGANVPAALAPLVAPFVDVPRFSAMPFVPLFAWLAVGAVAQRVLARFRDDSPVARRAGASGRALLGLAALGLGLAFAGTYATRALVESLGGPLSRAHVAVIPNVLDLAGRGLLVLALGAGLSLVLPDRLRAAVIRLGQGSLVAYVVHVPFCYGRLAGPLLGSCDMATASLALPFLVAVSWGSVYARDALRSRLRAAR
ncbi:MAG: DUF1624 domain-containing protein [Sandaracinus sp.]|nr:DUF1624 domain-containing protein [Sandaracinus sp.]